MSGVFHYQSMDTPDLRGSGDAGVSGHRSMGNGRSGNGRMSPSSPLKLFGQAKKNINEIFKDVLDFLSEADTFVEGIETSGYIEGVECLENVKEYRERVCGIIEVLSRDHMKVVFFGRTSNGKSTTINAMLREKILPTGIGHTTNCFLQVEGSDSHEGYLLTEEEPDKPKSVQSIKQLASALSNVKLKENSLIRILWPKNKCRLLREDVVLVDSPGIDVTPDLDLWIDKFCLDADVFVLVSNAESTLMQTLDTESITVLGSSATEMDLFWSSLPGIPKKLKWPVHVIKWEEKDKVLVFSRSDNSYFKVSRDQLVPFPGQLEKFKNLGLGLLKRQRKEGTLKEFEGIGVKEYVKRHRGVSNIERSMRSELTALEEKLLESQELLETRGKYGRGVPVIIPSDARDILLYLASSGNRTNAGIRPSNRYLFPNSSDGVIRAYDALKKVCSQIDLLKPEKITSVNLRKYTATISQVFDLSEQQQTWLVNHLGHSMDIHKIHYRQTSGTVERLDISKLMLLQEFNLTAKYAGKRLDDIKLTELVFDTEKDEVVLNDEEQEDLPEEAAADILQNDEPDSDYQPGLDAVEEAVFDEFDFCEDDIEEQPKKVKSTSHGKRQKWTPAEMAELTTYFKENINTLTTPGMKTCLKAIQSSKSNNGQLCKRSWETVKKKEKNFFHKVSARLSKPNIFILQNRWDISAFEDDVDQVKQQHLDRNLQFLCDELTLMDHKEGMERVFFVSSREALASRLKESGTPTPTGVLQEGFQERLFTFANFERVFEECISKSAVRTKFEQHTNRGKSIITDLRKLMEDILRKSQEQMDGTKKTRREMADELDYMEKQLLLLTNEIKDKIKGMVEDVERKVASTLNDEIKRLAILVDEFERPFHADQTSLNIYKKDLHEYLEQCICRNLIGRCSGVLRRNKDEMDDYMTERLSALLPQEAQQQINTVLPKRDDFEIAYRLDCRNLCSEFQEDISFHFSLGPMNLFSKLMGRNRFGISRQPHHFDAIPRNIPMTPQEPRQFPPEQDNEALIALLTVGKNIGQRSAIAVLVIGGVIYKAVGWKVLAVVGGMYTAVYCYERLTWTNKAKERAFKSQYVDYAISKLRLIVDLTSSNCSHQVQQELTSTFARLCNQADITKSKLEDEIKQKDITISQLGVIASKSKTYRNKGDWLDKALDSFKDSFLTVT